MVLNKVKTATAMMKNKTAKPKSTPQKVLLFGLGLLIIYLPTYVHKVMDALGVQIGPDGPPSVMLWNWLAASMLIGYILYIERQRLSSISLTKPQGKDIEWAFWFWGIGATASWLAYTLFPPGESYGTNDLLGYSLPVLAGIVITAAITEEIFFRGYLIERLRELTGALWLAAGVSIIVFVLPHLTFFGPEWLLYHGVGTVLLYVLYVWRRNLLACMVLHVLGNLPLLLVALGVLARP